MDVDYVRLLIEDKKKLYKDHEDKKLAKEVKAVLNTLLWEINHGCNA